MVQRQRKILVVGAFSRSLVHFRGSLIKAMVAEGHAVFAAANGQDPDTEEKLRDMGVGYHPVRIARAGMNPLMDLVTLFDLIRVIQRIKPDVVLSYTIKPIIYGGLAAQFCGVRKIYSLVEGLGHVFMPATSFSHCLSSFMAKILYRIGLKCSTRVFFVNPDDVHQFVQDEYVPKHKSVLISGMGVDLARYEHVPPSEPCCFRFLLIARLLLDKGIGVYAGASRMIRNRYCQTEFHLVGDYDTNPAGLKEKHIKEWVNDGVIRHHGQQRDVRPFLRACHVFVLPSYYREGTPQSVLEAMATGRAIITTDAPGCRETVRGKDVRGREEKEEKIRIKNKGEDLVADADGWVRMGKLKIGANGILVPVKNVEALAAAMEFFFEHPEQVSIMGKESRRYAEERYDVHKVNAVMLCEMGLAG